MTETEQTLVEKFTKLGLSDQKAKETLKNKNVTRILTELLEQVDDRILEENQGLLLYHLATKTKPQIHKFHSLLVRYISDRRIDSTLKLDKAIEYLLANSTTVVTEDALDTACGVGVVVTVEQVEQCVRKFLKLNEAEILEKRYGFNTGTIMRLVRGELVWADGKDVKNQIDSQIFEMLGPKVESDLKPKTKTKEKKPTTADAKAAVVVVVVEPLTIVDVMRKINFHKPGENFKTEGYVITPMTGTLLKQHLERTGGQVRTRFPPEPNGILHIGHAKAININFGYALANNGICILRFDDTNPEKEEEKFFKNIIEMVSWLGYKPHSITYSSDYFDLLFDYAVQLIRNDLAYVCHQSSDELKGFETVESPWRNSSVADNLTRFEKMKNGEYKEGEATLRMKIKLEEGKSDPVAYRIKFKPHHRTKDKWCIYPTYDFTHCICDSIENITHSLCTKEFQSRRSSYYWLCNALNIYCPVQWEYGRLNFNYSVVSKRKIGKLISEKIVDDWDDPRLFTLTALKRRGVPPQAVNNFCAQLGVTGAQSVVDPSMLDAYIRDYLNLNAPRVMVVLDPLKVTIRNYCVEKFPTVVEMPNFATKPEHGSHPIAFDSVIFIEQNDFQAIEIDRNSDFKRLTLNQNVGLRHAGCLLKVVEIVERNGKVDELICDCESIGDYNGPKPKAFIHWVADPLHVEVRLYKQLFMHKNPEDVHEVPGGFLTDCVQDSLTKKIALADKSIRSSKVFDRYQFERLGYFSVDPDTSASLVVFNQTVSLKEDSGK